MGALKNEQIKECSSVKQEALSDHCNSLKGDDSSKGGMQALLANTKEKEAPNRDLKKDQVAVRAYPPR